MANDNPQYLWGRKNPNWDGPQVAHDDSHAAGGRDAASGDFSSGASTEDRQALIERMEDFVTDNFAEAMNDGAVTIRDTSINQNYDDVDSLMMDYSDYLEEGSSPGEADKNYAVNVDISQGYERMDAANYRSLSPELKQYCADEGEPRFSIPLSTLTSDSELLDEVAGLHRTQRDYGILNSADYSDVQFEAAQEAAFDDSMRNYIVEELATEQIQDELSYSPDGTLDGEGEYDNDKVYQALQDAYSEMLSGEAVSEKFMEYQQEEPEIELDERAWNRAAQDIIDELDRPNTIEIIESTMERG